MALRKRLFCSAKQPLLPCKAYAFTLQNNRFWNAKTYFLIINGLQTASQNNICKDICRIKKHCNPRHKTPQLYNKRIKKYYEMFGIKK
ncbi:hypothetical protein CLI71_01335 [Prevotella intermedia]|uniref:Uncharacterized protein n=1 Tax=Prevotella intermedia TaxID=28131 RepID=A0A2A6EI09_PREIN|nr:hypothetical protein CLI71_01335 [Prevotella intermedia]